MVWVYCFLICTLYRDNRYYDHPGWRIVFCFFPSQNQFLKLTNSCCFCTLDMGLQSWCVVHVCTYVCVCVCVCARVQIMCAEWTLWGSAHEGSALLEYVSPASSTPDPFLLIYWETVPSTNFSVPDGASGFYSPLTLVKNVFWEPWESFGMIMDLFKTKQSQDIEKILKKKKKRKTSQFWFPRCVCPAVGLLGHKAVLFPVF